jgi:hypothetical protein
MMRLPNTGESHRQETHMRFESIASLITSVSLISVGAIHLLPLSGVLGPDRLTALYGIDFSHPSLSILMRHRAVLFGLLGVFLIVAAFKPQLQASAFVAGFVSVASFLWIASTTDQYNAAIRRVVVADWVALVLLAVGLTAYVARNLRNSSSSI